MKIHFKDDEFSFQLLRVLGASVAGGADIGECLKTAYRITEGDFESWYAEWRQTAEQVEGYGRESEEKGHLISAGESYLRAFSYYRAAEFFLHDKPTAPRVMDTWSKSRECFVRALDLLDVPYERVAIPYEKTTLPGYFFVPDRSELKRKTVILNTGFDGTAEELYLNGISALRRGYNLLVFEGPGQGAVIREQGIPFRPDWEAVITPVIDWLLSRPDVDPHRITLVGESMGGYLAPRAAAHDDRIAALVANGGVMHTDFTRPPMMTAEEAGYLDTDPEGFDAAMHEAAETDTTIRWAVAHGMYVFGAGTPHEWLQKSRAYTLEGVAGAIRCPTLVIDTENERSFASRARPLYDALTCEKTWMYFTDAEGAGEHCEVGAAMRRNQRIFDWIDDVFQKRTGE